MFVIQLIEGDVISCARPWRGIFLHPARNMPVKDFVISVNNIVLYVSLAVIWLFAFIAMFTSGLLPALGVFRGRHPGLVHRFRLQVRPVGYL